MASSKDLKENGYRETRAIGYFFFKAEFQSGAPFAISLLSAEWNGRLLADRERLQMSGLQGELGVVVHETQKDQHVDTESN